MEGGEGEGVSSVRKTRRDELLLLLSGNPRELIYCHHFTDDVGRRPKRRMRKKNKIQKKKKPRKKNFCNDPLSWKIAFKSGFDS